MFWVLLVHLFLSAIGSHDTQENLKPSTETEEWVKKLFEVESSVRTANFPAGSLILDRRWLEFEIGQDKQDEDDAEGSESEVDVDEDQKEKSKKKHEKEEKSKDKKKKRPGKENKKEDEKEDSRDKKKEKLKESKKKDAEDSNKGTAKKEAKKERTTSEAPKTSKAKQFTTRAPKEDTTKEAKKKTSKAPKQVKKTTAKPADTTAPPQKDDEKEQLKKKLEEMKRKNEENKAKAKEASEKADAAEKKAQKAEGKLQKEKEKKDDDDETKKILNQGKGDETDEYVGSIQFPVLDVAKGYLVDISDESEPAKLTNEQLSLMRSNQALNRKVFSGKKCPLLRMKCKCGFQSMFWAYTKLEGVKDFCYGVTGKCSKCDGSEKMDALGFDYNYDKESKKAEVTFVEKPQNDRWFAGHIPLYKYACNEGYVITRVENKYEFKKASDKNSRAHQKTRIFCGKLKIEPKNAAVNWYNCFTKATRWTQEKRKWCREVRKDENYKKGENADGKQEKEEEKDDDQNPNFAVKADEPARERNVCEDVKEVGKEKQSCTERMQELKEHFQIKTCPESLANLCPLSCGTCCGDNHIVKTAKGKDTKKPCGEHVAELKKANQECTDLLKGQCPHSCGLCKMPGEKSTSLEESLSVHPVPLSNSFRIAYALTFFTVLLVLFILGCMRTFNTKSEDLYVEFQQEEAHLHEQFLNENATRA